MISWKRGSTLTGRLWTCQTLFKKDNGRELDASTGMLINTNCLSAGSSLDYSLTGELNMVV